MRVLFDHCTPYGIARYLVGHEVTSAYDLGWHELTNGKLLDAAEKAGYDVRVNVDQNIRYQQNLRGRKIALVVLTRGPVDTRAAYAAKRGCGAPPRFTVLLARPS